MYIGKCWVFWLSALGLCVVQCTSCTRFREWKRLGLGDPSVPCCGKTGLGVFGVTVGVSAGLLGLFEASRVLGPAGCVLSFQTFGRLGMGWDATGLTDDESSALQRADW